MIWGERDGVAGMQSCCQENGGGVKKYPSLSLSSSMAKQTKVWYFLATV
jgi:hypothetical protein